ncbi:MAG: hypothetical protein OXH39_03135 [Candidatus Poribacteria bacterium]|nr:hypothetical protein [Candidatus Poribacteria bacterium]
MFRVVAKIISFLILLIGFMGCGNAERYDQAPPKVLLEINKVLDQWRQGYETEDVNAYIGTFWEEGFLYVSDWGTDGDKTDDLEFDDIRQERDAAIRVFKKYQDIEIELSVPPEISMNEDGTQVEVRNHYRIQLFISDGHSLEGGFSGVYAEGDNLFIFEKRNDEWRIAEWHDEAYNEEEIRIANSL